MIPLFAERSSHSPTKIRTYNRGKQYRINYNTNKIGKDEASIQLFSQRQDVQQVLPCVSSRRKVHLTKVAVMSRSGEAHEYLALKQGRKRFIFDMEEHPLPATGISEEQKRKGLSLTLVVPQQIMRDKGLIPKNTHDLRKFTSKSDARRFFRTLEKEGYFATRGITADPKSLENNTDFIQPVPAVIVKGTNNTILFTLREGDTNHDERLSGKISVPFSMGHSEPHDFGLWRKFLRYGLKHAMFREAAEETALKKGQKVFHVFPSTNGHDYKVTLGGILQLNHYYHMQPFGVVYSEETPIDRVHAGVIFVATPRRKNTSFTSNGSSREITKIVSLSPQQYNEMIAQQKVIPASWNEPVVREIFTPRRKRFTKVK